MSVAMNVALWIVALIVLVIAELATIQLVSIWFVIGTIPAMIVAGMGGAYGTQFLVFVITSFLVLVLARPYLMKKYDKEPVETNVNRVIGTSGHVLQDIDNVMDTGRVHANGLDWTARTKDGEEIIPKGAIVTVLAIQGVKLIVAPQPEEEFGEE